MYTIDTHRLQSLNTEVVGTGPVLYIMVREQRVHDNWALLYALEQANKRSVPLLVLFVVGPMFQNGSARHNEWMIASLKEVSESLASFEIPFFVEMGDWVSTVAAFAAEKKVGEIVLDFNPLEPVRSWREELARQVSVAVTVVDAHNIIPCWQASLKAEFAAYTMRPKIHRLLSRYLTLYPKLTKPSVAYTDVVPEIDWETVRSFRHCDYTEVIPTTFVAGEKAAMVQVKYFIEHILPRYIEDRNDPTKRGTSDLSPYIRWGNVSVQRIALMVEASDAPRAAKDAFLEELIVRRELAENYCYYTKDYATVGAAHAWAQKTISEHKSDQREYIYTYEQFRDAKTHDALWNAAQLQMVCEGKMHGFMRMYWAKKILEWTPDAQTATDIALTLNDRYELDGRDSNGVVGVMWSICGVHDRAWNKRPVFGKIRYMNYAGCKRKFDVKAFESRYNGDPSASLF